MTALPTKKFWSVPRKSKEPEPPVKRNSLPDHFGPASLVVSYTKPELTRYEANLWVGGPGYQDTAEGSIFTGTWGVNVQLTVETPRGLSKSELGDALSRTLERFRGKLSADFDEQSASVVIHAIRNVALGHSYSKGFSAEEILAYDAAA